MEKTDLIFFRNKLVNDTKDRDEFHRPYYLPIKKIDDVLCECWFDFVKNPHNYYINVKIVSTLGYDDGENLSLFNKFYGISFEEYNEETLLDKLYELFNMLNTIKFSKYSGKFYTEDDDNFHIKDEFMFLGKLANLSCIMEECCVCKEITISKTECNHALCRPCMFQLKPDEEGMQLCPICRENL